MSPTPKTNLPRKSAGTIPGQKPIKLSSSQAPAVVLIAPPWPRSGASRIFQNQIDFYRSRGFRTALAVLPHHPAFMRSRPIWDGVLEGMEELGAHKTFLVPLDGKTYKAARYVTSLRHAFRGTSLDWTCAMAASAPIPVELLQFLNSFDVALLHVNYVQSLAFAQRLRRRLSNPKNIPLLLDTHDVQAHLLKERKELNPWTHKPDPLDRLIRSEVSAASRADILVHLSLDDFHFFQQRLPGKPHFLTYPAIDEEYLATVRSAPPFHRPIDLLFVGQKHAPNLAAVKWFFEEVWPLLTESELVLNIVGPIDTLVKEQLPLLYEAFRSCFVGPVTDLAPYYTSARCVIAPMVSGSGTSIKTIEALALGKPFVGTPKAFRGMPAERIHAAGVSAYESPRAFADAVQRVLSEPQKFAAKSRKAYDSVFSVEANFASRDQALDSVVRSRK